MKFVQLLPFSILGISFWFFLGFPFANYHESYEWIAQFNTNSVSDVVFQAIGHYSSYRPLGQATAITLYKLFNDSMLPIQLFNYCIIVVSFFILISASNEKKGLSLVLAIVGGFFFMGFSILFHLHGLYYSSLLLLIAVLVYFYHKPISVQNLLLIFLVVLITSLFHPYAIYIFIFFTAGYFIEKRKLLLFNHYILGFSFIIIGIVLAIILVPDQTIHWEVKKLLSVYKPLDKNLIMSAISVFLSLLTIRSIKIDINLKNYFSAGILLLVVIFYVLSVPVIFAWFLSAIFKTSFLNRWTLVFLIAATLFFPMITGFESRHLYFLILIVCAYTVPLDWELMESKLNFIDGKKTFIVLICVLLLFLILKQGIHLPVISNIVKPLLVEKEKTHQLEKIVSWLIKSEYKEYNIKFVSEYSTGSGVKNEDRSSQRFPTKNIYLNNYLNSLRPNNYRKLTDKLLLVCFDNSSIENAEPVYFVLGKWAGKASVFVSSAK